MVGIGLDIMYHNVNNTKKNIKHTENFNTEDVFKIVKIAYQDFNQALDMAWKIRNQWLENIQGRADYLKNSLDKFFQWITKCQNCKSIDEGS